MLWLLLVGTTAASLSPAPVGDAAVRDGVSREVEAIAAPPKTWPVNKTLDESDTAIASGNRLDASQESWIKHYQKQPGAPDPAQMLLNEDPEPALDGEGFEPLFNGTDLSGWTPIGGDCTFEARGGQVVGVCVPGSPSTYLCTERKDYKDFVFTCRMRWEADGNSGVMIRSVEKPDKKAGTTAVGPQAEMEGFEKGRGWSGGIYGQGCGGFLYPLWLEQHAAAREALKEGEWNRLTIHAEGPVVKTWVNGVPVAHWVDTKGFAEGFFGLQIHAGRQGTVVWDDLRVKELNQD
ncbi:hypothetical protein MalM25_20420 [Planctomycetes bacterium MalM25]|nr:hypothetical protein MalM25_20420 [Planctomycetes bacterium MalM25]